MQKPTSEAIRDQVATEVAEQLPGQVSALIADTPSKATPKRKKRKTLAKLIASQSANVEKSSETGTVI